MFSVESNTILCKCFACEFSANSSEDIFAHLSQYHDLDVIKLLSTDGTPDQLDYVKLVNFLRRNGVDKGALLSKGWKDDQYLKPVLENDPLLYFDVEDIIGNESGLIESGTVKHVQKKLEAVEAELLEARATIEKMKLSVHKWLGENESSGQALLQEQEKAFADEGELDDGEDEVDDEPQPATVNTVHYKKNIQTSPQRRNVNNHIRNGGAMEKIAPVDSSYFCSYAGYSVHKDMLQDQARTLAYLNFIKQNRALFEGKVVIDVGCGTGILSMFAVRYGGARKVFALEPSSMAFQAIDTIAENGISPDKITVINAPVESAEVERVMADFGEKADIVISEWMGYFMIFENMLPSVIYARDKFARPDGLMAPSSARLYLDATDSKSAYDEFVGFWGDVYGFSMQKMKRRILRDAQLFVFQQSDIVSTASCPIITMDLNKCPPPPPQINAQFNMSFSKATELTAFIGWFVVDFEGGAENVILSTAPGLPKTHWQQTAFFLPEPVHVEPNKSYPCSVTVNRCENDHRSLTVNIKFKERNYKWALCRD